MGNAGFTGVAWLASNAWAYPALEVAHITGMALMLGSLAVVDLRVWGQAADLPMQALARLGLRVTVAGFALVALSGLGLFAAHPAEMLANRAFILKMGLVMLAGLNAAQFHARGSLARADGMARFQTVLSMGLWLGAIFCGRWIAYCDAHPAKHAFTGETRRAVFLPRTCGMPRRRFSPRSLPAWGPGTSSQVRAR